MPTNALSKNTNKDWQGRQLREQRVPAGWVHAEVCTCSPDHHVHVWNVVCPTCHQFVATRTGPGRCAIPVHDALYLFGPTVIPVRAPRYTRCTASGLIAAAQLVKHSIFG